MTEDNPTTALMTIANDLERGKVLTPSRELAVSLVQAAARALAETNDIDEVKDIHDKLRVFEVYFKKQHAERIAANEIVYQRIRTIQKLGGMLLAVPRGVPGPKSEDVYHNGKQFLQYLREHEIPQGTAYRWQYLADNLDDEDWRTIKEEAETNAQFEATVSRILRFLMDTQPLDPTPAPPGTFNVIYADPPWPYDNQVEGFGATNDHYPKMPLADIQHLPESTSLSIAPDAVLFMWATNPFLNDALSVVDAWGFEYKTNLVWVKSKLKAPGVGFYVRGQHELLFICTRGSFTPLAKDISPPIGSVITAPVQDHSRKPQEVYDLIERLYPKCNYVELFARSKRDGWKSWGNEVQ